MFVRLSRTVFTSATRCPPTSVPLSVVRVSRRPMSATSHASAKSDTPWLIGSIIVFGPALLYLLSPSARKNTHGIHNDHHDFPALKHGEHKASQAGSPATVEDGEGTEANVTSSIALSEESDVNNSTSLESDGETIAAAKTEAVPASEESTTTPDAQASEGSPEGKEKGEKGGEGPAELSKEEPAKE